MVRPYNNKNCSSAIVQILENHGVTHVFGVPGAKIDSLFIALNHSKIKLITCRHEQNAAFMAAAFGRLTGKIGVCIATSGPGVANLTTGLATATSEGDPVLAIGGEVPLDERIKKTHQSLDAVGLMKAVTKYSEEVVSANQLGEIIGNAIRRAESDRPGAAFVSLPQDIGLSDFEGDVMTHWGKKSSRGPGSQQAIIEATRALEASKRPIVMMGMQSSSQEFAQPLVQFLKKTGIPYISTFQGAGAWVKQQSSAIYAGRIGLFRNQPTDKLLDQADLVITLGYNPIEYDPSIWNANNKRPIICIDSIQADQDNDFIPTAELIGDIGASLMLLGDAAKVHLDKEYINTAKHAFQEVQATIAEGKDMDEFPVQPLRLIHELQKQMTTDTHVALDVGSNYIWTNRYCVTDNARQVLVSNGQQTLGVSVPWAISLSLLYPDERVLSISGDGGFLFSSMELETAVRIGAKFVHVIWDSCSYDMVAFQEQAHYGESAGVKLGSYDVVKMAESFGCKGYSIKSADELPHVFQEAFKSEVPVLIHVLVDYSLNARLMEDVLQSYIH
ncbi:MAG: acetolactate synthase AlsS [Legionellaceae bacterium]|nr:acetolactate synthase AlsS [Legionellaceae bacterium]